MKRKYIVFGGVLLVICLSIVFMYNKNYSKEVTKEDDVKKVEPLSGLAIMLETKYNSGVYNISTTGTFPEKGYEFNSVKSGCENGGTLSYNEQTKKVTLKSNISDKCYVYFDVVPPDVSVAVNNLPTTYGKLGSITCDNSSTTYNQKYNRIEVSQINGKYTSCTLNYTDSTSKVNFADYIMSLAGTTQGSGEVVNEAVNKPDYSTSVAISNSSYISQSMFSSTSASSTSGTEVSGVFTFANNTWTSVPSAMTSDTYYHFKFNPSENGYYQMCYNLFAGNSNNRLYAYVNAMMLSLDDNWSYLSASSETIKGCIQLGYLSTLDYIKIVQRAYTNISKMSFSLQKVATVNLLATDTRYEGKNPNNYVWFNNEYWRIIGVFDSASHGVSGKKLVKIIRADVLDGLSWDKSNHNDWSEASLNSLLNGAYYNAQDGTNSGYCYGRSSVLANCDYTKKGIKSNYRNMIAKATWHLGGYSSASATAESFYGYERGTTVYNKNSTSTTGYIGLMYPSDYGYSVLSSSCARTTNLSSYGSDACTGQSWLYGKGYEWTLSPDSSYHTSVIVLGDFEHLDNGILDKDSVWFDYTIRPVLYLDASVYKIDGEGTLDKPYIIGM